MAIASAAFSKQKNVKRKLEIEDLYFNFEERMEIATATIRQADAVNDYHCPDVSCGNTCRFAPQLCPNEGCKEVLSRTHISDHDAVCSYKLMPCTRGCGEQVRKVKSCYVYICL